MKIFKKNEDGYALLIVLLLVVFIMAITAVFMRSSISNAKQEKKVDENHLSVVAAEMGVDYYSTLFTNRFLEVRKEIWNRNISEFKVRAEEQDADINKLADDFRKEIAKQIINQLQKLSNDSPKNSDFNSENNFQITLTEEYYILISGSVFGNYKNGKQAHLDMELFFPVPPLLVGDDQNDESDSSGFIDIKIPNLILRELSIDRVKPLAIIENVDNSNGKIQNNSNGFKNINTGKISLGRIQSNGKIIEIKAMDDIQTENLYENNAIEIQGNKKVNTAIISGNKANINIRAIDDINLSSDLYGNKMAIDVISNLKLNIVGNVGENVGRVLFNAGDDITVGKFKDNKGVVQITTLGKFTSGPIEGTQESLTILSKDDFTSGQLKGNSNVTIETSGKFNSGSIHESKGFLIIKAKDDINAEIVQDNNNVYMHSNKKINLKRVFGNVSVQIYSKDDFTSKEVIQQNSNITILTDGKFESSGNISNNTVISISSKDDFKSTELIQDNSKISILTNGKFSASKSIYGNNGITIFSKDDFSSGNIQANTNLKIVTLKKFSASHLRLGENSVVCVGGKYDVNGEVKIPTSSHVYVKGEISKNRGEEKITKSEWEEKCGFNLGDNIDGLDEVGNWDSPIIDVDY